MLKFILSLSHIFTRTLAFNLNIFKKSVKCSAVHFEFINFNFSHVLTKKRSYLNKRLLSMFVEQPIWAQSIFSYKNFLKHILQLNRKKMMNTFIYFIKALLQQQKQTAHFIKLIYSFNYSDWKLSLWLINANKII